MIKAIILDFNGVILIKKGQSNYTKRIKILNLKENKLLQNIWWRNKYKEQDIDNHINNKLINFIKGLKPKIKLGLITNAGLDMRKKLENLNLLKEFDCIVISGEENLMKPDPKIYNIAIDRLKVNATEAIFIDDNILNVKGAKDIGMISIHADGKINLIEKIKQNIS